MRKFAVDKVEVTLLAEQSAASWGGPGGASVVGTEVRYRVCDGNFNRRKTWEIAVRIPNSNDGAMVQPIKVPALKLLGPLDHSSVLFMPTSRKGYRGWYYCKLFIADASGEKNRKAIPGQKRGKLPKWFKPLLWRVRHKETVAKTAGTDGRSLVVLCRPNDHEKMVQLFLAMRAWVLVARFEAAAD